MDDSHKFQFDADAPVHVWSARLDPGEAELATLTALLDDKEVARARRFHFERDRRHFAAARGWLRWLLGRYLNADPAAVSFGYGVRGKPFLVSRDGVPSIRFNVSHSHGRALYAFARDREMGVDLEAGARLGEDWPGLVKRIFSQREREELFSLPIDRQRAAFLNGWTRKEAFLKATGQGLVDGLQSIEVTLDPARPAALLAANSAGCWTIHDLRADEQYAAALVIEGGPVRIARFECASAAVLA